MVAENTVLVWLYTQIGQPHPLVWLILYRGINIDLLPCYLSSSRTLLYKYGSWRYYRLRNDLLSDTCKLNLILTNLSSVTTACSYFVRWNDSLLTQLASLLFWVLLGDVFWRAATRDGKSEAERQEGRGHTQRRFLPREMSFDTILVQASAPLG